MPFGDSITEGDFNGGYRGALATWAAGNPGGYSFSFVGPYNWASLPAGYQNYAGGPGSKVEDLQNGGGASSLDPVATVLAASTPDLIVLMIGINNLFSEDASTVSPKIASLLAALRPRRTVLQTVLDNQDSSVHTQVVALNALLPGVVSTENGAGGRVVLYDAYTALGVYNGTNYQDATHPNATGYALFEPGLHAPILSALALS
jgi:lysophospholipase L1-like esterase